MGVYKFKASSTIPEIRIETSATGELHAHVFASDTADSEKIKHIAESMRKKGWVCTPTTVDGETALKVYGFKKRGTIAAHLVKIGASLGSVEFTPGADDKPLTRKEKLHLATLRWCGVFNLLADAGFLYDGVKEFLDGKGVYNLVAGIFYAIGSTAITLFGSASINRQLGIAAHEIIKELEEKGILVPEISALHQAKESVSGGFGGSIKYLTSKYCSQVANLMYSIAGAMVAMQGVRKPNTPGWKKAVEAVAGASTAIGGIVTMMTSENVEASSTQKRSGVMGVVDWFKERPLRISSITYGFSTLLHGLLSIIDKQWGRLVFAADNVAAEVLMGISSKDHAGGKETRKKDTLLEDALMSIMAEVAAMQEEDKRAVAMQTIAAILAKKPEMKGKPEADILAALEKRVEELKHNVWRGGAAAAEKEVAAEVDRRVDDILQKVWTKEAPVRGDTAAARISSTLPADLVAAR